jgi:NAD(P)-dependent dehydrogenase (short-subunit alcohol dehydrogenase family)
MTEADLAVGIESKLLGQIRLVLFGRSLVSDGGSFTLTSGYILDDPIRGSTSYAVANGGVEGFVRAASLELGRGIRLNAVSPGMAEASVEQFGRFNPGRLPVPMAAIGAAYVRSVEGIRTGEIIRAW